MLPCIVTNFFLINPTRRTNFPNFILLKISTCFGHLLFPSSGVFYCIFDIGIPLAGLMRACKKGQIILTLFGEVFDKIKFGKFVSLVGFIKKKCTDKYNKLLSLFSQQTENILPCDLCYVSTFRVLQVANLRVIPTTKACTYLLSPLKLQA
jgi:hypothetical protein